MRRKYRRGRKTIEHQDEVTGLKLTIDNQSRFYMIRSSNDPLFIRFLVAVLTGNFYELSYQLKLKHSVIKNWIRKRIEVIQELTL